MHPITTQNLDRLIHDLIDLEITNPNSNEETLDGLERLPDPDTLSGSINEPLITEK